MLPVIALVGRPNVGKSTIFNFLTKTRDALVSDFPGLTRDRKYGHANFESYSFIVVDTAGIDDNEAGIDVETARQSFLAIQESELIFFVVDSLSGLMHSEHKIAQRLRDSNRPVYVVVNKSDNIDTNIAKSDFYRFGFTHVFSISATQGKGFSSLIEHVFSNHFLLHNEKLENNEWDNEEKQKGIKVAFVGRPNVGKSTLTNRILGEERVVVFDMPGTTRDSIYIPFNKGNKKYTLIDTAGVRRKGKTTEKIEKFSVIKTLRAIEDTNVAVLVIDATLGLVDQDLSLLSFILNSGRALVIVVNKWDGINQEIRKNIKEQLEFRLGFVDFARIHFVSALKGQGIGKIFDYINEAYESANKKVTTSMLTKIMQMAQHEHSPPIFNRKRVKLKYAHVGGHNPPIVVIHGNQVEKLPETYRRYLMNYFRRSLGIMGTPLLFQFKDSENPYSGQKNKLTPTQQRKRQRLLSFIKKNKKRG